ncbi:MAG: EAL domain-containing protein [Rhodoferax sp.]|uniref:EAL domain-containing protein n=1 Tax=Rhodoferax sp. TaxID=50421 RepID=UPI0027322EFA|nr:EAL domain-containing protein [Rhodoferax sp.]MDP2678556.1 EAL domain-containing protein [Rhodoferax sp.]
MPSFRLRTTILYLVLAAAWIYLSDQGLAALVDDPSPLTNWQSLKGLAFILLNGGLVYWLAGRGAREPDVAQWVTDSRVRWASVGVFVVAMALGVGLIAKTESTRVLQRRAIAQDRAADHAHALQLQIDRTMSATYALAAMVRQGEGRIHNFEALTTQMLPLYSGVSALALAPGGVVTEIVPLAGNERAIGIDHLKDTRHRPEALKAMRSRTLMIEGPVLLNNGSRGLIGRLAVYLGAGESARFWGFVTAVAKMDELMRLCNLQQMAEVGYHYRLVHLDANAPEMVLAQSTPDALDNPVVYSIQVSNSQWELSVVPVTGWHFYPSLLVEILLALLASALLAFLAYVLLRQPQLLRREVALRTRELAAANHRLGNLHQAVEQSPATVMITDREGKIEYVNPKFTELTGYTVAEAIGRTPKLIQSGLTSDAVYTAMWQTLLAGREWRGELCNRKKNGELFWEFEVIAPVRDEQGDIAHFIAVKEEVTERRLAQVALERLNRTLRVLSAGNKALVRTGDETELLAEVGRILIEVGGYCLIWVGMPEPGNETVLGPVMMTPGARVDAALLTHDRGTNASWPGFVGAAMTQERPIICTCFADDAYYVCASEAVRRCCCEAGAALPLVSGQVCFGVLVLHADNQETLGKEELTLLQELADDLAYGIATRRHEDISNLREQAIEASSNGIMISSVLEADHPFTYVNPAFERITGYGASEAVGRNGRFLLGTDLEQPELEAIRLALREGREGHAVLRNYRKDGSLFWCELSVSPVRRNHGSVTHFVSVLTDITESKNYEAALEYQSNHDQLTGLPNRNLLADRLDQALVRAARDGDEVAVAVIDLDRFKVINDGLGHTVGDILLKQVVARLQAGVRDGDTLARLGGDEFVLIMPADDATRAAQLSCGRLQSGLVMPFEFEAHRLTVSASIGISLYPRDAGDAQGLLRHAEAAMYRAKEQGRSSIQFFTAEINKRVHEQLTMESQLRQALDKGEFLLHYQPQVDLVTGSIIAAEALVRWQHPERGMVPPLDFIALAEETGLIVRLGEWVLVEACRQHRAWLDAGLAAGRIAVNLSPRQFSDPDLLPLVKRVLANTGLPPALLDLEVTESMAMQDVERAIELLEELACLGVRISIDDFGTGHSSLSYLQRFAVKTLKIDRSFVHEIAIDPQRAAITSTIIVMAHNLGMNVIAEGVETLAELNFLRRHACDEIQGYYFSRPLGAAQYQALLREQRRLVLPPPGEGDAVRTLLLVDDEPNVLSSLKRLLRRDGYRILSTTSAREGLDLLATNPVQVIISDQRMPEMSGTEFLLRARQLHPHTVRLVLSGSTDLNSVTEAINDGAIYKVLIKPWNDDAMRETVRLAFKVQEDGLRRWPDGSTTAAPSPPR